MKKQNKDYYLGLDIGTNSIGYAVTDTSENYNLLKYNGEPMWGSHLFEEAKQSAERRGFRTARRRLDRRQQRVLLLQELFANEISKVDENFYKRITESALLRSDKDFSYSIFEEPEFSDIDYYDQYPTIHHLIMELINNEEPHDVRLVYLACAWLVAHRGHFLYEISKEDIDKLLEFDAIYDNLMNYLENSSEEYIEPWHIGDKKKLSEALREKTTITRKQGNLINILFDGVKPKKAIENPENFPYSVEGLVKLLSGGTYSISDLFGKEEYKELGSFSLGKSDEEYDNLAREIGDDIELLLCLRKINDWAILADLLSGNKYISESKVQIYKDHAKDLRDLKYIVKKYIPDEYNHIFREIKKGEANYVAYSKNIESAHGKRDDFKGASQEEFCKYINAKIKDITPFEEDIELFNEILERNSLGFFMPKQVTGDNRVIPYQLYYIELEKILSNAEKYLPFIKEKDAEGLSIKDKILSIMEYRIPYYVGPLNSVNNQHAWIVRKSEGKILPWNFDKTVDLDKSEQAFIQRMTNTCTYLPNERVLPKHSLIYEKFEVLNEINNIKINGIPITVELKQELYNELFCVYKKVTAKKIKDYLVSNNICDLNDVNSISGIDITIKSSLSSKLAFKQLLQNHLTEEDVERIIERITYSENKTRLRNWIISKYPTLSNDDVRYITSLKFKDFGRLSKELLMGIEGTNVETGEMQTIISALWNTNDNFQQLLSEKYTFSKAIAENRREYYDNNHLSLSDKLEKMYISNAVKRPIIRTLDIIKDVVKAEGCAPKKIFIEMARGASEDLKNKRTKTRKQQILDLYSSVKNEDVKILNKTLEEMGDKADNNLQSDVLFLYYMQLGKCMYTGENIDIDKLRDGTYNVDHIYPQSKVKDDSILNNKVLVLSEANEKKGDRYPLDLNVQQNMQQLWYVYKEKGLITDEKYRRLTRKTPFSADEEWNFINRQLVETRQSTKAIAILLKEKYPQSEIVYVKAGLVSDFRHEFGLEKSRRVNDLHHAKDAYLNVVCGNVYNEKFTKKWFLDNREKGYSIKQKILFGRELKANERTIWNGEKSLDCVKSTVQSNNIHLTEYAFCRKGAFFDQMPVKASEGLTARKKGMNTEHYGGYNKAGVSFFSLVKYKKAGKEDIMLMPVELLYVNKYLESTESAKEYAKDRISRILGKDVEILSFPIGRKPIKINTILEIDGFRMAISSIGDRGKRIFLSGLMPLKLENREERYIKRIESFFEKKKLNEKIVFNEKYDMINSKDNIELYDILLNKYITSIYSKRLNSPQKLLEQGRNTFAKLDEEKQAKVLLNILDTFGRIHDGCNLKDIGGDNGSAVTRISSTMSTWKKNFKNIKIINVSPSGIWEKETQNLLELL